MRCRGSTAGHGLPTTPDEQGFAWREALYHVKEATTISRAFDIHSNHRRVVILQEVLQQIGAIQHHGVAITDRLADLQTLAGAIEAEVNGVGATLGEETHVPSHPTGLLGMVANAELGMIHPHTVGANERQVRLACQAGDGLLQLPAFGLGSFRKASGKHRYASHTLGNGIAQDRWCGAPRDRHDDEVHRARDISQAGVIGDPQRCDTRNLVRVNIDRVHRTGEGAQVA